MKRKMKKMDPRRRGARVSAHNAFVFSNRFLTLRRIHMMLSSVSLILGHVIVPSAPFPFFLRTL